MTKRETDAAAKLLKDEVQRTEQCKASTQGGWCLTAHWIDGGQKLFYSLAAVQDHLAEREMYRNSGCV